MSSTANSLPKPEHQQLLDTSGLVCPEPIMLLHQKLNTMHPGETLLILATDPATTRDIPKLCQFLGHQLLLQEQDQHTYSYWLQKA